MNRVMLYSQNQATAHSIRFSKKMTEMLSCNCKSLFNFLHTLPIGVIQWSFKMKIIFASLAASFFLSCTNKGKLEDKLLIQPALKRSYDTSYSDTDIGSVRVYDISLSLINKTDKPISFWIMKCSWWDNFTIDKENIYFYGDECNGNFPTVKYINTNDSMHFNTSIFTLLSNAKMSKTIRIGFVFVDETRFSSFNDYLFIMEDKSRQDSILWSSPLQLR